MLVVSVVFRVLLLLSILAPTHCEDEEDGATAEEDGKAETDRIEETDHDSESEEHTKLTDNDLHEVHKELDANGDKKASKQELMNFAEKHQQDVSLAETDPDEIMAEKDTSKDGKLSLEEHLEDAVTGIDDAVQMHRDYDATKNTIDVGETTTEEYEKAKKYAEQKAIGETTTEEYEKAKKYVEQRKQEETEKFKAADLDHDGLLNKSELTGYLSPETHDPVMRVITAHAMRDADTDGNGELTVEEFTRSDMVVHPADTTQDATNDLHRAALFKRLDTNSDGHIDVGELHPLKSGKIYREDMVNDFVTSLDKDADAHIDPSELVNGRSVIHDSDLQDYFTAWAMKRTALRR